MLIIDIEKNGDVVVVRCTGRIVRGEEVRTLRQAVVCQTGARILVLDLADVELLDAGGLTALLGLHQWALGRGVQFKLANPSPFVRDVLARTRLDRVFDISSFDHAILVLRGVDRQHTRYAASC